MANSSERERIPRDVDFSGVSDRIVEMRCQGYGVAAIAKTVGLARTRVESILRTEFTDRFPGGFESRDELKRKTALELDYYLRPLREKYTRDADAGRVDRKDAEVILKFIEQRCKLFGLNEPVRIDVRQVESLSDADLEAELARHGIRQLEPPRPPPQLPPAEIEDAEVVPAEEPSPPTNTS